MKDEKTNYRTRREHRNKNYDTSNAKKNLLVASNDGEEVKNILSFNEEVKDIPNYDDLEVVPRNTNKKKLNFSFNSKYLKYGLSLSVFLVAIFGVSYSFFNYRKEDSRQADISSGEVYVKLVENTQSINLTKMYPRTDEEARERNDNYFDFTIKGKNTSETKAVIYNILINNGDDISGKTRISPSYVKVDLQEKVGQTYEYISEGVKLSEYNFTGAVLTNTTSEITREYRIRFWISDDVTISDTDPNASYTAIQFNNIYATYDISVSSEDKTIAYNMLRENADTETVIDFGEISSSTNGQGLYRLAGTQNANYPIYYYRGDVTNNNVIFGGYCWQMIRTTDTGGIKMIYNGEPEITGSGENISYNCGVIRPPFNSWKTTNDMYNTVSHSVGFYYADGYEIVSVSGNGVTYRLKSITNPITQVTVQDANEAAAAVPTIVSNYPYSCFKTSPDATCLSLFKVDSYSSGTSVYSYPSGSRTTIDMKAFNANHRSLSDVGYMFNERYLPTNSPSAPTGSIYGKDIEWHDDHYLVIEDVDNTPSTNTTLDDNHHYSCGTKTNGAGDTECSTVRYYEYSTTYIEIENGDLLEDVLYKMIGTGTENIKQKHSSYNLNSNDSTIKTVVEDWFRENLTNEINSNNVNYQVYLEDTAFVNDRTLKTIEGASWISTYAMSGWNPNGGSLNTRLGFGIKNRLENNNWYSAINTPILNYTNLTDKFSVSNSKAKLNYPVGLLTVDEVVLAGANGNTGDNNTDFYLNAGTAYWLMTPNIYWSGSSSYVSFVEHTGTISGIGAFNRLYVRPVISLKLGIEFESSGDGTPTNPYVVKYN